MGKMAEQLRTILKGTDLDSLLSCETRIFRPGYDGYEANAYRYAKTSHDGMAPNMIIYPTSLDEILKIVDWAKKKKNRSGSQNWRTPIFRSLIDFRGKYY